MKTLKLLALMVYVVTWKAIGMGDEACDFDEYTGAKVYCQKQDVEKRKDFNTQEGADAFVSKAPKAGIKDMKVTEKEQERSGFITFR